jgi:hypothetical protein
MLGVGTADMFLEVRPIRTMLAQEEKVRRGITLTNNCLGYSCRAITCLGDVEMMGWTLINEKVGGQTGGPHVALYIRECHRLRDTRQLGGRLGTISVLKQDCLRGVRVGLALHILCAAEQWDNRRDFSFPIVLEARGPNLNSLPHAQASWRSQPVDRLTNVWPADLPRPG